MSEQTPMQTGRAMESVWFDQTGGGRAGLESLNKKQRLGEKSKQVDTRHKQSGQAKGKFNVKRSA